jgi:hypothetical protein
VDAGAAGDFEQEERKQQQRKRTLQGTEHIDLGPKHFMGGTRAGGACAAPMDLDPVAGILLIWPFGPEKGVNAQ